MTPLRLPGAELRICLAGGTISAVRVVIVGAGVVGTMHAWIARRRGHVVVQLDGDEEPRGASVRNFGLIWVSGRAPGNELALARRARELWAELGRAMPGVGLRPDGSLTVAQRSAELALMRELAQQPDAGERGIEVLNAAETRRRNPALRGELIGSLYCAHDAIVEPRAVLANVRAHLARAGGYEYVAPRVAREIEPGRVEDHTGAVYRGDLIVVCPGADHDGVAAARLTGAPLRRCRLQMLETEPYPHRLTTALADGDSLRYYPAFDLPARAALAPPAPIVEQYRAQLLVAQRASGALTIGDTHHYDEPYDFAVDEVPYRHLLDRAESLLGGRVPAVARRWAGVYSQTTTDEVCVRVGTGSGVVVVTGLGGRGMTLSPAVAEQTFDEEQS